MAIPAVLTLQVLAAASGLIPPISVVGAPALDCPDVWSVERALAAARTSDGPPPMGESPPSAWRLNLDHVSGGVEMRLQDPTGTVAVARTLPAFAPRCDTAADAVAIVVERYFRDLAGGPPGESATKAASPSPSSGSPTTVVRSPPAPPLAAEPALGLGLAPAPRFVLSAGGAYWTRAGAPSVAIEVGVPLGRLVRVNVGALVPGFSSDQPLGQPVGEPAAGAHLWGIPLTGRLAVAGRRGRWGAAAGAALLLTIERGQTMNIAVPSSAWRAVLACGVGLDGAVAVSDRLRVGAGAAVYRAALGRSYQVEGVGGQVLEPPAWQALVGARVEWLFFL